MTTGATVRAAAKAVTKAGAANVWVATLARARQTMLKPGAEAFYPDRDLETHEGLSAHSQRSGNQHGDGQPSF
jgi:hypothetical protein